MDKKQRVLFICTGNAARSQMAEAFLRHYAGEHFEVASAGLEPKGVNPTTLRVMEERGFDMSAHSSKPLKPFLKEHFHYAITVCERAEENCPVFPVATMRLSWPFDDPAAATGSDEDVLAKFREVRDQIETRLVGWLEEKGLMTQLQGV